MQTFPMNSQASWHFHTNRLKDENLANKKEILTPPKSFVYYNYKGSAVGDSIGQLVWDDRTNVLDFLGLSLKYELKSYLY